MWTKDKIPELFARLREGDIVALSRAITLVESRNPDHEPAAVALLEAVLPFSGNSIRIGITGIPGVGKSTFIESFGMHWIEQGKKVAVLAIDPSSSKSKGSILGDKTRMERLSAHKDAFIRPTASGGSLGGITYRTREAILLCEAAGFEVIIVETVGVGQSETEVRHITDFFLLLMLAGAGDELQGIKRGIMEMADGIVITKADGNNLEKAKTARSEYARALHFLPPAPSGWIPPVKLASAINNIGIAEIADMVDSYVLKTKLNGFFLRQRQEQSLMTFDRLLQEGIFNMLFSEKSLQSQINLVRKQVEEGSMHPYSAVSGLVNAIRLRINASN